MTKAQKLWNRLKEHGLFNSHTVRAIGFEMWYDRADRTVRMWAEEGKLYRIPDDECVLRGLVKKGNAPLAWWEIK